MLDVLESLLSVGLMKPLEHVLMEKVLLDSESTVGLLLGCRLSWVRTAFPDKFVCKR